MDRLRLRKTHPTRPNHRTSTPINSSERFNPELNSYEAFVNNLHEPIKETKIRGVKNQIPGIISGHIVLRKPTKESSWDNETENTNKPLRQKIIPFMREQFSRIRKKSFFFKSRQNNVLDTTEDIINENLPENFEINGNLFRKNSTLIRKED